LRTEMQIMVCSPNETDGFAEMIASLVQGGDVIGLIGPLGAGKTRFTQALFRALGTSDYVRSPSFALVNEYESHLRLVHMDFYRLDAAEDIFDLGYEEYLSPDTIVVIEWADRALEYLPQTRILLTFELVAENPEARRITLEAVSQRAVMFVEEVVSRWRCSRSRRV